MELSRTFANFDVLAFPSETDTFGLVVLEAFASGVPAVVTDKRWASVYSAAWEFGVRCAQLR